MARLVIETEGRRRIYEILEDQITVGSDRDSQVRLPALRTPNEHLLLIRRGDTYRVAALHPGTAVRVNGDDVTEHTLRHGDRIEIADSVLMFLDEDQLAASSPPSSPSPEPQPPPPSMAELANAAAGELGARPRARRSRERGQDPRRQRVRRRSPRDPRTLAMTSAFVCLAAAAVYYLIKTSPGRFSKSPESLLSLAEHQAQQGYIDRAIGTLQSALQMQPDSATRDAIERQLSNLQATLGRRADQGVLTNAATGFRNLEQFESAYLTRDPGHRPACRELVRKADTWLESYREICLKYEDEAKLVATVEAKRERYAPAARLTEPDTADDVMFLARSQVRVRGRRRYRDAVGVLDAFLARAPGDPRAAEVREMRADLVPEGESWLGRALRQVERMIAARQLRDARDQLDFLAEQALPEWMPQVDAVRTELERTAR